LTTTVAVVVSIAFLSRQFQSLVFVFGPKTITINTQQSNDNPQSAANAAGDAAAAAAIII